MKYSTEEITRKLKDAGLKVTPQRLVILEAIYKLGNHPTADNITEYIRSAHPGVATGTVYNVLDVLVDKKLVRRVKTDRDAMRYDGILEKHHHLYCAACDQIEDYFDEELDTMLKEYFKKKKVRGFEITDIILQLNGNFDNHKEL
jgi:Fur family peroxide stress response transcriptional regulator